MTCIQGTILARCQLQLLPTIFPLIGMSTSLIISFLKQSATMAHLDAWIKTFTCTWRDIDPFPRSSSALYATAKQRKWPRDDATSCSQFVSIVSASTYTQGYTSSCMCLDCFNHLQGCFHSVDMAVVWPQCLPLCSLPCPQEPAIMASCIEGPEEGLQSNKPWDIQVHLVVISTGPIVDYPLHGQAASLTFSCATVFVVKWGLATPQSVTMIIYGLLHNWSVGTLPPLVQHSV